MTVFTRILGTTVLGIALFTQTAQAGIWGNSMASSTSAATSRDQYLSGMPTPGTLPAWLQRVEWGATMGENFKPEWNVLTVQPLWQSSKDTVFTQLRAAYNNERTTGNLGLGWRRLAFDDKALFGVNSFYDHEWPYNHQRLGFGAEILTQPVTLTGNWYNGMSGWQEADTGFEERALDGRDIELGLQFPYMPWIRLYARQSWFDTTVASRDIEGQRYALQLTPTRFLQVELAHNTEDNLNEGGSVAMIRISLAGFGERTAQQSLIDSTPWHYSSMQDKRLQKVRRDNSIRVERRATGAGGAPLPGTATVTVSRGG